MGVDEQEENPEPAKVRALRITCVEVLNEKHETLRCVLWKYTVFVLSLTLVFL